MTEFINIKDVRPNFGEEVLIITHNNIRNIQVATYDRIETDSDGDVHYFYDGRTSSITPTHWLPKSRLKIK